MGPHDSSTDAWAPGMSPEQKIACAVEQLKMSARAASELEVPVVNGLIGSHVWDKWYIFPPANEKLYEQGFTPVRRALEPVLDEFKKYGVKWGLEVHPTGIAYNIETAQRALAALDHRPEFGFNFDPSHLVWQLIDPVIFIKTFGRQDLPLPRQGRRSCRRTRCAARGSSPRAAGCGPTGGSVSGCRAGDR